MKKSSTYSDFIEYLNEGKICLFETDTVVGIGCRIMKNGLINENLNKIFDAKKRSKSKTFPWLISSKKMLDEYAINISDYGRDFIKEKWPGATTLIFECRDTVPEEFSVKVDKDRKSLAFRIPDSEELINAIDFVSCPIATTSANITGNKPVFSIKDVDEKILDSVDFIYENKAHKLKNNSPSEIVSCLGNEPKFLRLA